MHIIACDTRTRGTHEHSYVLIERTDVIFCRVMVLVLAIDPLVGH